MSTSPNDADGNENGVPSSVADSEVPTAVQQDAPTPNMVIVEVWKQTVEVQQHFNDLQLKLRSLMITLVIAILGAAGFAINKGAVIVFLDVPLAASVLVAVAGFIATAAFYLMDYGYHMLLKGAVKHSTMIEEAHGGTMPEIELSKCITAASTYSIFGRSVDSTWRLHSLYRGMLLVIIVVGVFGQLTTVNSDGVSARSVAESTGTFMLRTDVDEPPPIPQFEFSEFRVHLVLSVVGGETISIVRNETIERLGFAGIDVPGGEGLTREDLTSFAVEAQRFLNNALKAEYVYLILEPGRDGDDDEQAKAHVFRASDGLWINLEVVRQGYGVVAEDGLSEHAELFTAYQKRAKDAQKGIWDPEHRMQWKKNKAPVLEEQERVPSG